MPFVRVCLSLIASLPDRILSNGLPLPLFAGRLARKIPALEERISEAREVAGQKCFSGSSKQPKDDSRAAAEWLRLTFPNDYRKPSNTSVEVNTAVQMAVVCSEERRQELIEQRERLLTVEARKTE